MSPTGGDFPIRLEHWSPGSSSAVDGSSVLSPVPAATLGFGGVCETGVIGGSGGLHLTAATSDSGGGPGFGSRLMPTAGQLPPSPPLAQLSRLRLRLRPGSPRISKPPSS